MTTYRTIAATEDQVEAFVTAELAQAWTDNVIAAFEGDATAVAAGVTLKDPALDTGAATTAGSTWVALRTINIPVGGIGSYAYVRRNTASGTLVAGTNYAGSDLRYSGVSTTPTVETTGAVLSGTWRAQGSSAPVAGQTASTLALRIS